MLYTRTRCFLSFSSRTQGSWVEIWMIFTEIDRANVPHLFARTKDESDIKIGALVYISSKKTYILITQDAAP